MDIPHDIGLRRMYNADRRTVAASRTWPWKPPRRPARSSNSQSLEVPVGMDLEPRRSHLGPRPLRSEACRARLAQSSTSDPSPHPSPESVVATVATSPGSRQLRCRSCLTAVRRPWLAVGERVQLRAWPPTATHLSHRTRLRSTQVASLVSARRAIVGWTTTERSPTTTTLQPTSTSFVVRQGRYMRPRRTHRLWS
jgi:hypothetical protein